MKSCTFRWATTQQSTELCILTIEFSTILEIFVISISSIRLNQMGMARRSTSAKPWNTSGDERRTFVRQMFSEIAPVYDRMNGVMSLRLHHRWRNFAVQQLALEKGDTVVDLCTGTGDFLKPLRDVVGSSGRIFGIDFCKPMLELCSPKIAADKSATLLAVGDACRIPIASNSVKAVTVGWGMRNVSDLELAHQEIFRILKPGGRFVSLECSIPKNRLFRSISLFVNRFILPTLGRALGNCMAYTYLPESVRKFGTRDEICNQMRQTGFEKVTCTDLFFGNICLFRGVKP